jgi:hypothetical protein
MFVDFVKESIARHDRDDNKEEGLHNEHLYHLSYLLFWLEVESFENLEMGEFKNAKGRAIYDTYYVHGSIHQLPIGSLELERVQEIVLDTSTKHLPSTLYSNTKSDAFDALEISIFKAFYEQSKATLKFEENINADVGSTTPVAKRAIEILDNPGEISYFLEFGESQGCANYIRFWLEVEEWKSHFYSATRHVDNGMRIGGQSVSDSNIGSFHKSDSLPNISDAEYTKARMREAILNTARRIWTVYLCPGGPDYLTLSDSITASLKKRLEKMSADDDSNEEDVFDEALLAVAHLLNKSYVPTYLDSEFKKSYDGVLEKKNNSMLIYQQSEVAKEVDDTITVIQILADGRMQNKFKAFLTELGDVKFLLFLLEAEAFKNIPTTMEHYAISCAYKIFSKFFKRGSKMCLSIVTSRDRYYILRNINNPSATGHLLFESVANKAFRYLDENYRTLFLKQESREMESPIKSPRLSTKVDAGNMHSTKSFSQKGYIQAFYSESSRAIGSLEIKHSDTITINNDDLVRPTLDVVLRTSHYLRCLREFMQLQFSSSLVEFWVDAEQYKLTVSTSASNLRQQIITTYIDQNAKKPLPLQTKSKEAILNNVMMNGVGSNLVFQKAQKEIYTFIDDNLYEAFLSSSYSKPIWRELRRQQKVQAKFGAGRGGSITEAASTVSEIQTSASSDHISKSSQGGSHNIIMTDASKSDAPGTVRKRTRVRRASTQLPEEISDTCNDFTVLSNVLQHPTSKLSFIEFAKRTKCVESVYFYLDVSEYTQIPCSDYLIIRGRKLITKYIKAGSSMQVNISHTLVNKILESFDSNPIHCFDEAQMEVFNLMNRDIFPRYLQSKEYQDFLILNNPSSEPRGVAETPRSIMTFKTTTPRKFML